MSISQWECTNLIYLTVSPFLSNFLCYVAHSSDLGMIIIGPRSSGLANVVKCMYTNTGTPPHMRCTHTIEWFRYPRRDTEARARYLHSYLMYNKQRMGFVIAKLNWFICTFPSTRIELTEDKLLNPFLDLYFFLSQTPVEQPCIIKYLKNSIDGQN